jgi:hypothetical protein
MGFVWWSPTSLHFELWMILPEMSPGHGGVLCDAKGLGGRGFERWRDQVPGRALALTPRPPLPILGERSGPNGLGAAGGEGQGRANIEPARLLGCPP